VPHGKTSQVLHSIRHGERTRVLTFFLSKCARSAKDIYKLRKKEKEEEKGGEEGVGRS
jgi:hypothetical protein